MPTTTTAHRWVPYRIVHRYELEAAALGVSEIARSRRGFLRQYEAAGGARAMRKRPVRRTPGAGPRQTWGQRREAFIARHLPAYRRRPSRRRWLALMMWAYRP